MLVPLTAPSRRSRRLGSSLGLAFMLVGVWAGLLTAQTQTSIGIIGGVNSYDWQGDSQLGTVGSAEYTAKIAGMLGGALGLRFAEQWGARVEAQYDHNRTLITASDELVELSYIRVPVTGQFWLRFSPEHDNYLMISAGPSVGFNIGCTVADVSCDAVPTGDLIAPSLTDVSLLGTIGVAAGPALFELRYNLGPRNLNRIVNGPELKTREYMIVFSYYFTLKRGGGWF
jgi:hypothetical protein